MATVYDLITERIIVKLQQGTIPWHKPWNSAAGLPRNLFSQKAYRGINVWMLGSAGYSSPYWLTFKQAKEIGGHVRKGEQGSPVVFWKWLEKDEGKQERDETRTGSRRIPLARLYHVFNVQQCELPECLQPLLKSAEPQSPAPSHRFLLVNTSWRRCRILRRSPTTKRGRITPPYTTPSPCPLQASSPKWSIPTLCCSMSSPTAQGTGNG
jgi:antirestriction protein ArdC